MQKPLLRIDFLVYTFAFENKAFNAWRKLKKPTLSGWPFVFIVDPERFELSSK
jgi:hypothetical protein